MSQSKRWTSRFSKAIRKRKPIGTGRTERRFLKFEPLETRELLAYVVTSVSDAPDAIPGDGICATATGACTLRAAIQEANSTPGPQTIEFNIPGPGPHTIQPASPLPAISQAVVIDATTQPGYLATPVIELMGSSAAAVGGADGLRITGDGVTIRGFAINRFTGDGIDVRSNGNLISGNFIGTDTTGSIDLGNRRLGVVVFAASNNTIEGNLISGNDLGGVQSAQGNQNTVQNNKIGTNLAGSSPIGNGGRGVTITSSSSNLIGGIGPNQGNLISGNLGGGIAITGTSTGNTIQQNLIGTNFDGTAGVPNLSHGVLIAAASNTLGGSVLEARNIISGNTEAGVVVINAAANVIRNNYIGTTRSGAGALGNAGAGVILQAATTTDLGGTVAGDGNLVSGNMDGIQISRGSGNMLRNNRVGTNAAGNASLPNTRDGVQVVDSPSNEIRNNVVSGNLRTGIAIKGNTSNNTTVAGNLVGTDSLGASALGNRTGLVISNTAMTTITDNVLSGNLFHGVQIIGAASTQNILQGNRIGTNSAGTAAVGNVANGVVLSNAPNNTVGGTAVGAGNVISGNGRHGIVISGATAMNNVVQQNRIGTDTNGTAALPNGQTGVAIVGSSNNTVGGTAAGAGNVISGNLANGVAIVGVGVTGNRVEQNTIGARLGGLVSLGNGRNGVVISKATGNTIGGTAAAARNTISGNGLSGVLIKTGATSNLVQNNLIGTASNGTAGLGNGEHGVWVSSANNTVGGTAANAGNVISSNGMNGVLVDDGIGTHVEGNKIGTNSAGTAGLANLGNGVEVSGTASQTIIGGTASGAPNIIAFNATDGVRISGTSTRNQIRLNSIFQNGGLGIDLGGDGVVTPNDPNDPDAGANNLQNFPEILSVQRILGTLTIGYRVPSINPNSVFSLTIDIYKADSGEGKTYLGTDTYATTGVRTISGFVPLVPVNAGDRIVMTATDALGNTSEFSAPLAAA